MKKEFIRLANKCDEIYACIEYPSSKYQQIMDYIIQMNESNEFTLKTEIRITKIDEKEKLFYQNKYINFVLFEQPNEIISNLAVVFSVSAHRYQKSQFLLQRLQLEIMLSPIVHH